MLFEILVGIFFLLEKVNIMVTRAINILILIFGTWAHILLLNMKTVFQI